jgi:hypothetical protein
MEPTNSSGQMPYQEKAVQQKGSAPMRVYGFFKSIYAAAVFLAVGFAITWLSFRSSPLFAFIVALLTIIGVLLVLFRAWHATRVKS